MSLLDRAEAACPYCGEWLELGVDPSLAEQSYVEDCQICCQPIVVELCYVDGVPRLRLHREDGADWG